MTLVQLRYLAAVVDSGLNITAAARQVNATQPGLSRQLKQLEEELGFQLLVRRGRSIEGMTEAGGEVLTHARLILAEAANIHTLAAGRRQDVGEELRIATTHTQARFVLPSAMARLRRRFPDVRLHLAPSSEQEALGQLDQGAADIAIVSSAEPLLTPHLAIPIYRWDLVGLCKPGRLGPGLQPPMSLAALAATPLVTYESAREPSSSFFRAFQQAGLEFQLACTARDSDLIKTYVRAGLGLGVLAEMAVTEDDADLTRLDLWTLFPARTTWVVLRRERVLRSHLLELLSELAPYLERVEIQDAFDGAPQPRREPPRWRDLPTIHDPRGGEPSLRLA